MLFAVLGTMAVLWSLSTPMMGGPDEPAHAIKAAAVAHGQFNTDVVRKINPGLIRSIPITTVRVPRAYAALRSLTKCWLTTLDVPTSCAPAVSNNTHTSRGSPYVGS